MKYQHIPKPWSLSSTLLQLSPLKKTFLMPWQHIFGHKSQRIKMPLHSLPHQFFFAKYSYYKERKLTVEQKRGSSLLFLPHSCLFTP